MAPRGYRGRGIAPPVCLQITKALNDPLVAGSLGFTVKAVQGLWRFSLAFEENPSLHPKMASEAVKKQRGNNSGIFSTKERLSLPRSWFPSLGPSRGVLER